MFASASHGRRLLTLSVLGGALLGACSSSPSAPAGGGTGGAPAGTGGSSATGSGGASGASGGAGGVTAGTGGNGTSAGTGGAATGTGGAVATDGGGPSADGGPAGAMPSVGCGATPPVSGRFMIDVAGTMREYIVKVPAGYDPHRPYPLVFAFHGAMYSAQSVADGGPPASGPYYGVESEANGRAIFVAPQALATSWSDQGGRDVAYVLAMVARFKTELCVDQSRIFSIGFSMGGIMTLRLACTADNPFRAIAPMSASLPAGCMGTQRMPYWSSHGTMDPTISPAAGMMARDEFVRRNHCGTQTMPGNPTGCVNYQGCDAGYPVTWCTFAGVHQPAPFAGTAIWAFLSGF